MTWTAHTAPGRGRLRLAVTAAVALAALMVSTTGAAAAPPAAPAAALSLAAAGSTLDTQPRSLTPGFLLDLDRNRVTTFDAPQARVGTLPYDVNNRGVIVGRYDDGRSEQAFLRDARGRFTTLRIPGARSAWASGINDQGVIVGIYSENTPLVKDPNATTHGFRWDRGRITKIDFPRATQTGAFGINNRGQIVGDYLDPRGSGTGRGFLWDNGRFTTIKPPGAVTTTAQSINDRGQIVGTYSSDLATGTTRGFLLDRGRYATYAAPGALVTIPAGINNRGQISGFTLAPTETDPVAGARGFLLARGVNGAFRPVDVPGAPRTFATGLNDRGQIVGTYENPDASPQDGGSPPMNMPGLPGAAG
jgi:hypothetical protein